MATKKSQTPKKTTPLKKSELERTEKSGAQKKTSPVKKSSIVKKEIKPITSEETKVSSSATKNERESVKLLKEAVKVKTEASKNTSKPVSVTKHSVAATEEIKKKEINITKPQNEQTSKRYSSEERATYSKTDILKNKRINEAKKENEKNLENRYENTAKENTKEEIKPANENKVFIFENLDKNVLEVESEIKKEDKKVSNSAEDFKISSFPEIEKKPAKPYIAPIHHPVEKVKKSNHIIAILGILVIIAGLSLIGYQFLSSRNNKNETNELYVNNETLTNENLTGVKSENTNALTTADTNNIGEENVEIKTGEPLIDAETNVVLTQSPNPPVEPIPPTPPKMPEAPVFTPPVTEPSINTDTRMYKVQWKETLASIAHNELGDSRRWPTIFALNEKLLKAPDNFRFGINVVIPKNKKHTEEMTAAEKHALYNDYIKVSEAYARNGQKALSESIKNQAYSIKE